MEDRHTIPVTADKPGRMVIVGMQVDDERNLVCLEITGTPEGDRGDSTWLAPAEAREVAVTLNRMAEQVDRDAD